MQQVTALRAHRMSPATGGTPTICTTFLSHWSVATRGSLASRTIRMVTSPARPLGTGFIFYHRVVTTYRSLAGMQLVKVTSVPARSEVLMVWKG